MMGNVFNSKIGMMVDWLDGKIGMVVNKLPLPATAGMSLYFLDMQVGVVADDPDAEIGMMLYNPDTAIEGNAPAAASVDRFPGLQQQGGGRDKNEGKKLFKFHKTVFRLVAKITIRSEKTWIFTKISFCEIERDIEKLTATCTLVLPRNTKWHGEESIPVRHGDRVEIQLGYDDELSGVFTGYIRSVGVKTPVEIRCEDEMFTLKKTAAKKKTYAAASLSQLLGEQLPGTVPFKVFGEHSLGQYTVASDTVAQLLGSLQENGVSFFFRESVLHAGILFDHSEAIAGSKRKFFDGEGGNIISSDDLEWSYAEDMQLRIKASGTDAKGRKISVEVGDKDGEVRSFFKYNTTKETLEAEAARKLTEWKTSGLSGSFTTFGIKPVGLLDRISIAVDGCPEAVYPVTKNTVSYGDGGFRQTIGIKGKTS
jgi:hypothetical protein